MCGPFCPSNWKSGRKNQSGSEVSWSSVSVGLVCCMTVIAADPHTQSLCWQIIRRWDCKDDTDLSRDFPSVLLRCLFFSWDWLDLGSRGKGRYLRKEEVFVCLPSTNCCLCFHFDHSITRHHHAKSGKERNSDEYDWGQIKWGKHIWIIIYILCPQEQCSSLMEKPRLRLLQ